MPSSNGSALPRARSIVEKWLGGDGAAEENFDNGLAIEHCEHGLLVAHNGHAVGIAHHTNDGYAFTRAGYNSPAIQTSDANEYLEFLVRIVAERLEDTS